MRDTIRKKERVLYLDILRIIACFMVIANHTILDFFEVWQPCATWFMVSAYFFLIKPAVPIFVMLTGYTMLQRQDSYRKIGERFGKMLGIFLAISAFFYVVERNQDEGFGIIDFCQRFLQGDIEFAFWYMYLYLGILLMLPFLQKFVKGLEKKDFLIFFGISMGYFSLYPIVERYIPALALSENFEVPLFSSYICLLLLGYYFAVYVKRTKKGAVLATAALVGSVLCNVIFTYIEYIRSGGEEYLFFDNRTSCFIITEAVSIFYLAGFIKSNEKLNWVSKVGQCTFGMYLIHMFFIRRLKWILINVTGMSHILIGLIVYGIAVFGCSFFVIYLFNLIRRRCHK